MELYNYKSHEVPVTFVCVQTEEDSKELDRPCGQYITLETGPLHDLTFAENVCDCLADHLRLLLKPFFGKPLCIFGVGNPALPADSLGPEVAKRFLPAAYESFIRKSNFEKITMVCPGVIAQTNISSEKIIASIASTIQAACVLIIDSSTGSDIETLCGSICLTDNGTRSYQQVDLCEATLGVPVFSVGVPMAIPASKLCDGKNVDADLLVTPVRVMEATTSASKIIACAIAQAAYPELDYEDCRQYVEFFLHNII